MNPPAIDPSLSPIPPPLSAQSAAASHPQQHGSTPRPAQAALHSHHQHRHEADGLLPAVQSLFSIIVIAIFIITFCVQPFRIPSESMESTLLVGDFLLVDKQAGGADSPAGLLPPAAIHRGDIIVFHDPVDSSMHLVKRVIGVPGDRIRLRGGIVYIDGHAISEPYAVYRPSPPDNFRDNFPRLQSADPDINSAWWIRMRTLIDDGELIIPAGDYFVLGDNRNDSEDSRYWGFVPRADIVGKPLLIYFSLRQRGVDDTLAHTASIANPNREPTGRLGSIVDFARWSRTLQVVR